MANPQDWRSYNVDVNMFGVPKDGATAARELVRRALSDSGITSTDPGNDAQYAPLFKVFQDNYAPLGGGASPDQIIGMIRQAIPRTVKGAGAASKKVTAATAPTPPTGVDPTASKSAIDSGFSSLAGRVGGLENPYSDAALNLLRGQSSVNYANMQNQLGGTLASRGLLGSGMEAARRSALAGSQAASLTGLQSDFLNKRSGFEMDREKQLGDIESRRINANQAFQQLGLTASQQDLARMEFEYKKQQDQYARELANQQGGWQTGMNIGTGLATAGLLAAAPFTGGATLPFAAATGNAFLSGMSKNPLPGGGLPYDPEKYGDFMRGRSGKSAVSQVSLGNYYHGPEDRGYEDMAGNSSWRR